MYGVLVQPLNARFAGFVAPLVPHKDCSEVHLCTIGSPCTDVFPKGILESMEHEIEMEWNNSNSPPSLDVEWFTSFMIS